MDHYGSMYAGASLLLSTRSLLSDVESYLLPQKIKQSFWWNVGFMGVEFLLIDLPLLSVYHSFFGPGFRIRSLGGTVRSHHFRFLESDGSYIDYDKFWPDRAHDVPVLMSISNYEANQVLLQQLVFTNMRNQYWDRSIIGLYTIANLARLGYPQSHEEEKSTSDFNYLYHINTKHRGKAHLKLIDLKKPLLIFIPDFLIKLGIAFLHNQKEKK